MTSPLPPGITLIRQLGRGRLGMTSLCRDAGGGELVVTVLEVQAADDRALREMESEVRAAAAAFAHPCAVPIHPAVGEDRTMFLTQPYLAGGALATAPAEPDVVAVGGVRLAAALAQAHAAGMLHGDVRPSNVLRTTDGAWMLTAGGVAHAVGRAGSDSAAQPDPLFAAPEYFSGEHPGAAADVYSLGATLYAALVGGAPHAGAARDGAGALHTARLGPPPELPLSVPAGLAGLIKRMLAPDPAERPALSEADQVLRALAPAGATLPPPLPARVAPAPPRPAVRLAVTEPAAVAAANKRRTLVAGVAIGAVFLAGAGAVAASNGRGDDPAALVSSTGTPTPQATLAPTPVSTAAPQAPRSSEKNKRQTLPPAVTAGLVPAETRVFVYKGRLTVVWVMKKIADSVATFNIYTVRRDGTDQKGPFTGNIGERPPPGVSKVLVNFFDPDVPHTLCVRLVAVTRSGATATDRRIICATAPEEPYLGYAAQAYGGAAKPAPTPGVKRT